MTSVLSIRLSEAKKGEKMHVHNILNPKIESPSQVLVVCAIFLLIELVSVKYVYQTKIALAFSISFSLMYVAQ